VRSFAATGGALRRLTAAIGGRRVRMASRRVAQRVWSLGPILAGLVLLGASPAAGQVRLAPLAAGAAAMLQESPAQSAPANQGSSSEGLTPVLPGDGLGRLPGPLEAIEARPGQMGTTPAEQPLTELPALLSRLASAPESTGALDTLPEFDAGEPFEWWIECEHPAGILPRFEPVDLAGPGAPLDPDRGWALLAPAQFDPVERLDDGRYRSRAVLHVAALAGGVQVGESGSVRVPERRLPDLRVTFAPRLGAGQDGGVGATSAASSSPSSAAGGNAAATGVRGSPAMGQTVPPTLWGGATAEGRPDFRAPASGALAAPEIPGDGHAPGPSLRVRSLLDGQSAPFPLRAVLDPEPEVSELVAWRRAGLVIVLCGLGTLLVLRGMLRPLDFPPPSAPPPSLAERLRRARGLAEERASAPPPRELYYELSALLRAATQRRTGRGLNGHTDEEWLASQGDALSPAERQELEQLIRRLARAKYGPEALSPWAARELVQACEARLVPAEEVPS
jgi:hypothetical protein